MYSPLRMFNVSGQFRLHFRQKVKWFATELVKSGYLDEDKVSGLKLFLVKIDGIFLLSCEVLTTFGQMVCRTEACNHLPPCNNFLPKWCFRRWTDFKKFVDGQTDFKKRKWLYFVDGLKKWLN